MFKSILNLIFGKDQNQINTNGCFDEIDDRNFGAEIVAGQVTKNDLTDKNFKTANFTQLIDQGWTDFCVGASGAYAKQSSEGRGLMSWCGAYALACKYLGYVPKYGMSILVMMKVRCKYGIPEDKYYPFLKNKTKAYLANWRNMSVEAIANAYTHRDKTYFMINIPYKWNEFDTFRAYMNKLTKEKIVINTGADAHAISLCEQKTINGEIRIGGPDSYGLKNLKYRLGISINGFRYFNKYEVNQFFHGYIGLDMDRHLAELLNEYNDKAVKTHESNTCYLIKNGKKNELKNEYIAWAHNTLLFDPNFVIEIKEEELDIIPMGEIVKFKDGENWQIVQRMLEKAKKLSNARIDELLRELNQ